MSERLRVDYNASRRTTSHRRVRACPYREIVLAKKISKERKRCLFYGRFHY